MFGFSFQRLPLPDFHLCFDSGTVTDQIMNSGTGILYPTCCKSGTWRFYAGFIKYGGVIYKIKCTFIHSCVQYHILSHFITFRQQKYNQNIVDLL